jgi:PIN domain nuclease of toxin-antitoxin system
MLFGKLLLYCPVFSNNTEIQKLIGILPEHLDTLAELPFHHKDPFDRLIISQSLVENMPIITRDAAFSNYPITLIW